MHRGERVFEAPASPERFGLYTEVAKLYHDRLAHRSHDEELRLWFKENERALKELAVRRDDDVMDAQEYAPMMADVLGYMSVQDAASSEFLRARSVFIRTAERLYPEIAQQNLQPTKEGVIGTLEMVVSLLEAGEYQELADRLNVEIVHARRKSERELPKTLRTWQQVLSKTLDSDAYAAFKEAEHGQMEPDVVAWLKRELSFGIEAAYFLERMQDVLHATPPEPEKQPKPVEDLEALRQRAGHAKAFLDSRLSRMTNITNLDLDGDVARWRRLADGLYEIYRDYQHDNSAVQHKKDYAKRIDGLITSLRPAA